MKKKFYRIGTVQEQTILGQAPAQSGNVSGTGDKWSFTDGVIVDSVIYIPLESLAKKLDIPMEEMFCQELMVAYRKYQKRTGIWPIKEIDLWVENILSETIKTTES